jgi:hypothetical protein
MRLASVASATLSLLLVFAPALRAQDDPKPAPDQPKPDAKKDDSKPADPKPADPKKDDSKPSDGKKEKGDEGDDDDDSKPDQKLPINPFAKAKKGDWSVCVGRMKANFQGQAMDQKVKLVWRIKKVTDDEVECSLTESGGGAMGGPRDQKATFSLKENPNFTKYMNGRDKGGPSDQLSDWKVEDDKKTVGGKEFGCKKITAKLKDQMGTDAKLSMWVTDETKGWGCVAMTLKGTLAGGGKLTMDVEMKGYGNGDKADFGNKPEDEKAGDDEGDDDAPAPKKKAKSSDDDNDAPKKDAPKKDDDKKKSDDE